MTDVTLSDIRMVPGFELVEHTPGYTVLTIPSGFKIKVKRLGPHTFRVLDSREDLKDPGPFRIKVKLLENTHPEMQLEEEIIYSPPMDDSNIPKCPDKEKHPRAWAYFQQWLAHADKRREVALIKDQERSKLFMLNSIEILAGPLQVEDDEWLRRIECVLYGHMPTMWSERLLLFLQTQVITTVSTQDIIRKLATVEEVTLKGLRQAFDSFRSAVQRDAAIQSDG